MNGSDYVGYGLISLSAVLLAGHWRQWRDGRGESDASGDDRQFLRLQLQRRSVASGLIGLVGVAISLAEAVPRSPRAVTAYLFGLLISCGTLIVVAALDWRASLRRRHEQHLELAARELAKAGVTRPPGRPQ